MRSVLLLDRRRWWYDGLWALTPLRPPRYRVGRVRCRCSPQAGAGRRAEGEPGRLCGRRWGRRAAGGQRVPPRGRVTRFGQEVVSSVGNEHEADAVHISGRPIDGAAIGSCRRTQRGRSAGFSQTPGILLRAMLTLTAFARYVLGSQGTVPTEASTREASDEKLRVLFVHTDKRFPLGAGPWVHGLIMRHFDRHPERQPLTLHLPQDRRRNPRQPRHLLPADLRLRSLADHAVHDGKRPEETASSHE